MQESTMCFGKLEKPSKYEKSSYLRQSYRSVRICPDCDRKRSSACREPACNQSKKP
jgi:hypothetical protein